jgi:hypothetical protein
MLADADHSQLPDSWIVERRPDGTVLVRVPPRCQTEPPLPDAVSTFRAGDPQFDFWAHQLAQQESQQQLPGRHQ